MAGGRKQVTHHGTWAVCHQGQPHAPPPFRLSPPACCQEAGLQLVFVFVAQILQHGCCCHHLRRTLHLDTAGGHRGAHRARLYYFKSVHLKVIPVEGQVELCGLDDGLSVCERTSHAAEDPVVDLNHLVDGLRRNILSGEEDRKRGRADAQNSDLRRSETRRGAALTSTMALANIFETPAPGFNFDNTARNAALEGLFDGGQTPKPMKTGTTIAGVVFKDGVVLGADTRATSDEVVADKMCAKIHYISPNIYCCGAGTAADTEKTTDLLSSNLTIYSLNSGRNPRVVMAVNILQDMLYRYHGQIGANLILGGVDCTGNHLYTVGPYGSVNKVPYLSMGSGDLAALGILEDGFKPDLELEPAKELVRAAIQAGIMNDLGSGNNIDICVITKQGVDYIRPYQESQYKDKRKMKYKYRPGTTPVLTKEVVPLKLEVVQETVQKMETT